MICFHVFFFEDHVFFAQRGLLLSYQISPVRKIWAHMEGVIPKVVPSWELTYPTWGIGKWSSKVPLKRDMLVSRRVKCQNMSQKASFVGLCCTIATPVCFKGDGEICSCCHVASGNLSISDDEYPILGPFRSFHPFASVDFQHVFFFPHRISGAAHRVCRSPGMWKTQLLRQQSQGPKIVVGRMGHWSDLSDNMVFRGRPWRPNGYIHGLEPKRPLFWLEKAWFWGVDLQK